MHLLRRCLWMAGIFIVILMTACATSPTTENTHNPNASALSSDPENDDPFEQGLQAYADGDYEKAARFFEQVIEDDPDNDDAAAWLASVQRQMVTATPPPSPTVEITPTVDSLPQRIEDDHGVEMVLVPAGEFIMGSDVGFPDEVPVHHVWLDTYYIDVTEVTNVSYQACVDEGVCTRPRRTDCCTEQPGGYIAWPSYYGNPEFDDYPVIFISWYDARDYCEWRGARLLTEAEWEKAARGADGQFYPWGDEDPTPDLLNFYWLPEEFEGKPLNTTAPVYSYESGASPYGVLNMLGNVYQWVWDIYDPDYYTYTPYENPTGPEEGQFRVTRGGSFFNQAFRNRAANRNHAFIPASSIHFDGGARCGKDIPGNPPPQDR